MVTASHKRSFGERTARQALAVAGQATGVDTQSSQLLRLGTHAVFVSGDVVARVGRQVDTEDVARRSIAVSRWLRAEHVAAVEAIDVSQPQLADGLVVTFWRSLGDSEAYGTTSDLAKLLTQLHALDAPASLQLPRLAPSDRAASRIASVVVPERDRVFLARKLDELLVHFDRLRFQLPTGTLHGDASVGNVLLDRYGVARLIDLDGVCTGPREWDLILTAIYFDRYGWHTRDEYEAFVEVYGFDVMKWSGYEVLADLRELIMVTWMAQNVGQDERVASEFTKRMDALRTGGSRRDWQPF
jgi:aminoglycoside phosphotransferase (APT) family kinase protein